MSTERKFMTDVEVRGEHEIGHGQELWTIGSCFADEIGQRLSRGMLQVAVNPLGTLYNPLSIAAALSRVVEGYRYSEADIFLHEGRWRSLDFHSRFSSREPAALLELINGRVRELHASLPSLRWLMITLGSARVFTDSASGKVVANCHKLPASRFTERQITVDEAAESLRGVLGRMIELAPGLKVIFTVSPIRHKAYGYHADRLSKSTLLLAADRLIGELPRGRAFYFPAYEIMEDELRDYRFYASDMIHPSEVAADHIHDRFAGAWLTQRALDCAALCRKLHLRLSHRAADDTAPELAERFLAATAAEADRIKSLYPEAAKMIDRALRCHGPSGC